MHIRFRFLLPFLLLANGLWAQNDPLASKILSLVNEARTAPDKFLKAHRAEILGQEPRFLKQLEKAKPVAAVVWDPGLEQMSRLAVEKKALDPDYEGLLKNCGMSSGRSAGTLSQNALSYVCEFYSNVNDPDFAYLGLYFNSKRNSYAYYWGIACERTKINYVYEGKVDTSKVDFAKINTAKNLSYLSPIEKRMILEINLLRAYPQVYAQIVAQYLSDQSLRENGLDQSTYEAGMDLLDTLHHLAPMSILTPSLCIFEAAKGHGLDCVRRKILDHSGSNGSHPWDRIRQKCPDFEDGNENLAGNAHQNPREPLMDLLIDGGIPGYGHRYNLLNPAWHYVGVSRVEAERNTYYTMYYWVQNFA